MVDSSCVLPLPTSLVLLLHLHILSYPQCASPEYSPVTLFSPSRPLRDRTKTMEDIIAFLVEKIEGKAKCKSILGGTYPCLRPSDTVAFRVNAAKYLEMLRATVTRQGLQASTLKGGISSGKTPQAESAFSNAKSLPSFPQSSSSTRSSVHETSPIAWWWSAIVVRKSLLEESSGDRFERLLLALSTHALFVQVPLSSSLHPLNTSTLELMNALRFQSQEYANLLSRSLGLHTECIQSVSRLNIHIEELKSRRARLELTPHKSTKKMDSQRLGSIRNSNLRDLVDAWQTIPYTDILRGNEELCMSASDALKWISSVAGISTGDAQRDSPISFAGIFSPDIGTSLQGSDFVAAQTLPTASAHHPALTHKLRSPPSFASLHSDLYMAETSDVGSTVPSLALQELLHGASAHKAALEAALDSAVMEGREIAQRLDITLKTATAMQEQGGLRELEPCTSPVKNIVLETKVSPTQAPTVMEFLSEASIGSSRTDDTYTQQRIEACVLSAQKSLQPHIPAPSTLDVNHPHTLESLKHAAIIKQQPSKIPLATVASIRSSSQSATAATETSHPTLTQLQSRPYETSTPALKSHFKTVRAMPTTESKSSDTIEARLTHADSRGFTAAKMGKTMSPPQETITNMSQPDRFDADVIGLGRIRSQNFTSDREGQQEHVGELEQQDIPYEGHSVTLRDILLRVGDGEESFHLIGDLEDFNEHLGNETICWG